MITMTSLKGIPPFSKLVKNPLESDKYKSILPDYTPLGYCIYNNLKKFTEEICNHISIRQYVIMPDHIHFILEITDTLDRPLWEYMDIFKNQISDEAISKRIMPTNYGALFEPGFNDQYLSLKRNYDKLFKYIRHNPYWLWKRWENPEYFRRIIEMMVGDYNCSLYGNPALLEDPFIYPVVVHRADIQNGVFNRKLEAWKYSIYNGGVLIGFFISPEEKKIRDLAIQNGGKIIQLSVSGFDTREKPSERIMELCEQGHYLRITPKLPENLKRDRDDFRKICLFMNAFAERIAEES